MSTKTDVWIVDDAFVTEASISGMQLGEISELDMSEFNVVARYTNDEYEAMAEAFFEEHGHYPDS